MIFNTTLNVSTIVPNIGYSKFSFRTLTLVFLGYRGSYQQEVKDYESFKAKISFLISQA